MSHKTAWKKGGGCCCCYGAIAVQVKACKTVEGVTVTTKNSNGDTVDTGSTDAGGLYTTADIPPGDYTVTLDHPVGISWSGDVTLPCETVSIEKFFIDQVTLGAYGCEGFEDQLSVQATIYDNGAQVASGSGAPFVWTVSTGVDYNSPGHQLSGKVCYLNRCVTTTNPLICAAYFHFVTRLCQCALDPCGPYKFPGVQMEFSVNGKYCGTTVSDAYGYGCVDPVQCPALVGDTVKVDLTPPTPHTKSISFTYTLESSLYFPCPPKWQYTSTAEPCELSIYAKGYLGPEDGYCCPGVPYAYCPAGTSWPKTLYLNDGKGQVTLTASVVDLLGGGFPDQVGCAWYGCATRRCADGKDYTVEFEFGYGLSVHLLIQNENCPHWPPAANQGCAEWPDVLTPCWLWRSFPISDIAGIDYVLPGYSITYGCDPAGSVFTFSARDTGNLDLGFIYGYGQTMITVSP